MKREVSIVLSREVKNYRRLAQEWFGLTDEQMVNMDVHHNPPRHQGGRNIPEHLFVLHSTLHTAIHEDVFVAFAREGGRLGGQKCAEEKIGFCGWSFEQKSEHGKKAALKAIEMGVGVCCRNKEKMTEDGKKAGQSTFDRKVGCHAPGMASKGGKVLGKIKFRCLVTGHTTTAGALANFQRARGIDTSLRERLE